MTVDIAHVLEKLRIEAIRERGDEILALCPMHKARTGNDDNNPSWWINQETGAHICFSCGWKGNVFSLVGEVNEFYIGEAIDYEQVKQWLANLGEVSIEELGERLKNMTTYTHPVKQELPMSEARLALFTEPPQWALDKRQITAEAAKHYEILWNKDMWILPIRSPQDYSLWGWQEKGEGTRSFKNYPVGVTKSKTLFGAHEQNPDTVIVVESPLDAARIYSAGIRGAVATYGAIVSETQVKLLRYSDTVVAAFDNPKIDDAGRKASQAIVVSAKKYGMTVKFFDYASSGIKDVGDMTNDEIKFGIANAKDMIYGEAAYL